MLSKFDDYPIHQTPDPVAHPASSDKDVYERYWFNGYSRSGDMYVRSFGKLVARIGPTVASQARSRARIAVMSPIIGLIISHRGLRRICAFIVLNLVRRVRQS